MLKCFFQFVPCIQLVPFALHVELLVLKGSEHIV